MRLSALSALSISRRSFLTRASPGLNLPTPHAPQVPIPTPNPAAPLPTPHIIDSPSPADQLPSHSPFPPTHLPPLPNVPSPSPPSSQPSPAGPSSHSSSPPPDPIVASLTRLTSLLPPAHFVAAYGSAVFPQTPSTPTTASPLTASTPMIDLIVAVDHPDQWHAANLALNPAHYSFLRHFGPLAIAGVQDVPAHVYYNTHCLMDGRLVKYGVVSTTRLHEDLAQWTTLYLAGRLHKPVAILTPPPATSPLLLAMRQNLQAALTTALLLLAPVPYVTESALFAILASLSYVGDVRVGIAEDPGKVLSIVRGSFPAFQALYAPLMQHSQWMQHEADTVTEWGTPQKVWGLKHGDLDRRQMLKSLPAHLQDVMREAAEGGDIAATSDWQRRLELSLAKTIVMSSTAQTMKGVYTAGIRKSFWYGLRKLLKAWGK